MRSEELKILNYTGLFLLISLISGGASAILVNVVGVFDVIYAIHKITSVIAAIFFIILIRRRSKE